MSYISENEILELYLEGKLTNEDILELHQEGYLSRNITTELLGEGAMDYLKTVAKAPVVGTAKALAHAPKIGLYTATGGALGGAVGVGVGSILGPTGSMAGLKYGGTAGALLGGVLGAKIGYKSNRFDRGAQRNLAKIENWGHDKHFRDSHRKALLKAIKKGDHEAIDHHRNEMLMHQERMVDTITRRGAALHDMKHYDEFGNEIKNLNTVMAKNMVSNKDRFFRMNSMYQ